MEDKENKEVLELMQKTENDLHEIAEALKVLSRCIDSRDGVFCIKGTIVTDQW